jgi:hypothetical protein
VIASAEEKKRNMAANSQRVTGSAGSDNEVIKLRYDRFHRVEPQPHGSHQRKIGSPLSSLIKMSRILQTQIREDLPQLDREVIGVRRFHGDRKVDADLEVFAGPQLWQHSRTEAVPQFSRDFAV